MILPRWARRSKSLDALLPVLYLRGISTGDFQEALAGLLGKDAPNLSPSVIGRLTAAWEGEYDAWRRRDLSARRYVYIWADGVYLQARMEPIAECMLVVIGATPEGKKELVGFQVGTRESAQSWRELLVDLKARGLAVAPELAVGDGAPRLLEGPRGGVSLDPPPALLGAQGGQRPQRGAEFHGAAGQEGPERDHPCARTARRHELRPREQMGRACANHTPFQLRLGWSLPSSKRSLHAHRASRYEPGLLGGRNLPLTDATSLASRS